MRIPEYNELIDKDTIAFFPFNGNLTDMCGNYTMNTTDGGAILYTNIKVKDKSIKCLQQCNGSGARLVSGNINNFLTNTQYTIDFCFRLPNGLHPDESYRMQLLYIQLNDDHVPKGINIGGYINYFGLSNLPDFSYYETPVFLSLFSPDDFKNNFHHIALTRNNNDYSFFVDGKFYYKYTIQANRYYFLIYARYWAINLFNYRFSKGIRWTEDFISPYSELFGYKYLYDNENNIYGINK